MRRRTRPALAFAACFLVACSSTVAGTGTLDPSGSAPPDFPASSSPASSPPPVTAPPADLTGLLLTAPAGSHPWSSAWARNTTPTVEEWVAEVYPASAQSGVVAQLRTQGILGVVHRTWVAPSADQADMVLLGFSTASGAQARYDIATGAKSRSSDVTPFQVPDVPTAIGYANRTVDGLGNVPAIVYAVKGTVVIELFYYSPTRLRTADAVTWMTGQYERLPS
jgi:hypothetical protein